MTQELGRLERVENLREIWPEENVDFTPWLAEEDSLELLGDTIGMELELEATEKNVGPFRADILCKNKRNGSWVLIENQIERTDHKHLGQIFTYGAGLDAITIVWIASKFTEEHRAALDWLNKITDEEFRFFGLEVEAWKIGDSLPAPKFNIIAQPNDWSKLVAHEARKISEEATTKLQAMQILYWQGLVDYIIASRLEWKIRRPYPQSWHAFPIGRNGVHIGAIMNTHKNTIGVELCMENPKTAKQFFNLLAQEKVAIETEIGFELEWKELPTKIASKIIYLITADPKNEDDWVNQHAFLKDMIENFYNVFMHRILALDPSDWNPDASK